MSAERHPVDPSPRASLRRLRYRRPRLERLGDVRGLTLGASPGAPDSGVGVTELNLNP